MKALIVKEVGVLELQDIPEPECRPDEIKVKIAYAGICGTDTVIVEGYFGTVLKPAGIIGRPKINTPIRDDVRIMGAEMRDGIRILGHEASGTIVQIGKEIKGPFKVGQHVAMNYKSTCGACYYCVNGMPHFCERVSPFSGAMAEYSVYRENTVFTLPDNLPLDVGAFLEPLSIAVHSTELGQIKVGDSVIITGGGPIGLLILQLAIKSGASKVLVSEPIPEKRKLAKQLGADVVIDPTKEDLLEKANALTDGRGFNVCFEVSGKSSVARQLILLAEGDGTIVWVATYPPNDVAVPITYMHSKELTIRNVRPHPHSFPKALQMLPKLDLKSLITVYPFHEAIRAFEAHKRGEGIKIMLQL
jgi:(R,R)-butanediol dehydrogenase/meso-butanediol dehydrogenase/diacetyl reductase/L-iditol 2-dehydrogenase